MRIALAGNRFKVTSKTTHQSIRCRWMKSLTGW